MRWAPLGQQWVPERGSILASHPFKIHVNNPSNWKMHPFCLLGSGTYLPPKSGLVPPPSQHRVVRLYSSTIPTTGEQQRSASLPASSTGPVIGTNGTRRVGDHFESRMHTPRLD